MKKIFSVIILLSCFCSAIKGQSSGWFFINPQPTNMTLNSVKIFNQNNAVAIGYYGTVIRTTDGGLNWSNPLSTSAITGLENLHYFAMNFFDNNTGVILGNNSSGTSKIFKTTNMGATWVFVSQFATYAWAMYFINQNTGWVGGGTQVLRTTNGGSTWQNPLTTFSSQITSIYFQNELTGYAAVYSNKIYITSDGGINWNVVNTPAAYFSSLFFIDSQTGFACGSGVPGGSVIQKTTNSGVTWITKLTNTQTGTLNSIYFLNSMTGFAVGSRGINSTIPIYRSTDNGETWALIPIATTYDLNSIDFSGNLGLIVGYGGRVARSTDQGLSWTVSSSFHPPGFPFKSLCFIDANTGWIALSGYIGPIQIYRSINGGLNWEGIYGGTVYPDYIQFLNSSTGYYKSGNNLYKSTNSGYNWTLLSPLNITVASLNFVDVNTGWACGYTTPPIKPRVIKTINGGMSWDTLAVPLDYSAVTACDFINDNTGWIAKSYAIYPMGNYWKIYKTTNAGQNWVNQQADTTGGYSKISFINNMTGWASGGRFIKTTNGGDNWINLQPVVFGSKFQFIDANTGWAEVYQGQVYKTTNGGLNWYSQIDLGSAGMECMQFINSQTGWMVGNEGSIIKTTNGGELLSIHNTTSTLPKEFLMSQNYPNPFNPSTTIRFDIPVKRETSLQKDGGQANVKLTIYDVTGRIIATLINQQMQPGGYSIDWNATNYPSGVYFYQLSIDNEQLASKKMVLIK